MDAAVAELVVEHPGVDDLGGEGDSDPVRAGLGLIAAPPVVNRIVPEPRSSIDPTTVVTAATAPRTLNSSAARSAQNGRRQPTS
jgi:hypothetical protein